MQSTAAVDSPNATGNATSVPVKTTATVAPSTPAIKAPSSRGPSEARSEWEALQKHLARDGELTLDMSEVAELKRPTIAQVIRFLQAAESRQTRVQLINVPPKTHAMLEVLGVHHLVEITPRDSSQR